MFELNFIDYHIIKQSPNKKDKQILIQVFDRFNVNYSKDFLKKCFDMLYDNNDSYFIIVYICTNDDIYPIGLLGMYTKLDINSLYKSQLIGYMGNNIFPLRLGELLKAYYLEKKSKISKYEVLGTIILERVLDLVGLVLLFLILLNSSLFELIDPIYIKIIYSILIFTFIALVVSFRLNKIKNFKFKNKFFLILNDIISGFNSSPSFTNGICY